MRGRETFRDAKSTHRPGPVPLLRAQRVRALALKSFILRAPSSFQQMVENQMKGMLVLHCRSCACALLAMSIL